MKKIVLLLLMSALLLGVLVPVTASAEGAEPELLFSEDFETESAFQTYLLSQNTDKSKLNLIDEENGNRYWLYQNKNGNILTPETLGLSDELAAKLLSATTLTVSFSFGHGEGDANGYFSVLGKDASEAAIEEAIFSMDTKAAASMKVNNVALTTIAHGEHKNLTFVITNNGGTLSVFVYINGICMTNRTLTTVFPTFDGFKISSTSSSAKWKIDNLTIHSGNAVSADSRYFEKVFGDEYVDLDYGMIPAFTSTGATVSDYTGNKSPFAIVDDGAGNSYWSMGGVTLKSASAAKYPLWEFDTEKSALRNPSPYFTISIDFCAETADAEGSIELRSGKNTFKPFTLASGAFVTAGGTSVPLKVSASPAASDFKNVTCCVDLLAKKITYYIDGIFLCTDAFTWAYDSFDGIWLSGTNLFVDNYSTYHGKSGLNSASVSLGSDVKLNFIAALPASVPATATVTLNPGTADETVLDVSEKSNGMEKVYSVGLAPQCMGDTVRIDVKDAQNTVLFTKDYSVKEYCVAVLEGAGTELSALVSDLLVYGAEAQKYTGYKADALVTADLSLTPSTYAKPTDVHKDSSKVGEDTAFLGANVMFDYANRILFRFRTDTLEGKTLWLKVGEGEETEISASAVAAVNADYVYTTDDIKAIDFASVFNVSIKDGDTVLASATYSITDYVISMDENAKIGDLVKALYNYGQSARAYAD